MPKRNLKLKKGSISIVGAGDIETSLTASSPQ